MDLFIRRSPAIATQKAMLTDFAKANTIRRPNGTLSIFEREQTGRGFRFLAGFAQPADWQHGVADWGGMDSLAFERT